MRVNGPVAASINPGIAGAALAAQAMLAMGYLDVRSIAGGFDAWVAAGGAVAKPELPSFG